VTDKQHTQTDKESKVITLYFNVYVFIEEMGRKKVLNWTVVASMPQI